MNYSIIPCIRLFILVALSISLNVLPIAAQENFVVTVGQNKTFTEFNYHKTWFVNDPNNLPLPEERKADSHDNIANVSLSATPGHAGEIQAFTGVSFQWNLGQYTWQQVQGWPVKITFEYSYEIAAYWTQFTGSSNAFVSFSGNNISWYDGIGYEGRTVGSRTQNVTVTVTTIGHQLTLGDLEAWGRVLFLQSYCQAHSVSNFEATNSSYANVTVKSIKIEFLESPLVNCSFWDKDNPNREVKGASADGVSKVTIKVRNIPQGTTLDQIQISVSDGDGSLGGDERINNGIYTQTFTAPKYFVRDGHPEDLGVSERQLQSLSIKVNNEEIYNPETFSLIKPPVVLLHGLWANGSVWNSLIAKLSGQYGYDPKHLYAPSYQNSSSFDENSMLIWRKVNIALASAVSDGYVAKKADVVAHSMGGLLAKLYGHKSYIRSITTIGTPHYGSPWADKLCEAVGCDVSKPNALQNFLAWVLDKSPWRSRNGAIKDLRVTGGSHCSTNDCVVDVPNYVIVGVSPPSDPKTIEYMKLSVKVIQMLKVAVPSFMPELPGNWISLSVSGIEKYTKLIETLFPGERNDFIVSESSQKGLWTEDYDDDDVWWHLSEPTDPQVIDKIANFLLSSSSISANAPVQSYQVSDTPKRKLTESPLETRSLLSGEVTITSPTVEQTFQSGSTVTVTVNVSSTNASLLITTSTGDSTIIDQLPYTYQFVIPNETAGPVTILAGAVDATGFIGSAQVTIFVSSTAQLLDLDTYPVGPIQITIGDKIPLSVSGVYNDAVVRDLTAGVSYASSDADVLEVTPEGLLTGKMPGNAILTIGFSGITKQISVTTIQDTINGICGSSDGQTFVTAPTINLCHAGSANIVSGSGPWSWNCLGWNGGTMANCSANIQLYVIKGDIAVDGLVNLTDAILAMKVMSGVSPNGLRSDYTSSGVDANNDGKVGLPEVVYILQNMAGVR